VAQDWIGDIRGYVNKKYQYCRLGTGFVGNELNQSCSCLPSNSTFTAILFVKSYVEMYAGKLMKQKVDYKTFPHTTHSVIFLLILSSVAFHKALWPVYGGVSMIIMFLVGMFLLNFCLLFPTYVQNITAFALLTFFLQEYK
jgi:hypothetical protein